MELLEPSKLVFALLAIVASLFIYRSLNKLHKSREVNFDLRDLLMENDKVSKAACVMMGAFAVTTWQFIYYTLNGKLTEGYLGIYVAAWIAPVVARLINRGEGADDRAKVTSVTTTETTLESKK